MRAATSSSRSALAGAALAVLLALAAAGCGGSSSAADAGCSGSTGCAGPCAAGNSMGVGKHCTAGGGECNGSNAPFCTVDFNPTDLAFCTRTCADDSQCGEGASCTSQGGSGPMGCIPDECLGPGDLDAGVGIDASTADAAP